MIAWEAFQKYMLQTAVTLKIIFLVLSAGFIFLRNKKITRKIFEFISRQNRMILWMIIIAGLLLRFAWVIWSPHMPPSAATEDEIMLTHARQLAAGEGYHDKLGNPTAYRPIGYPLFLAFIFKTVGPSLWPIEIIQVLLAAWSILMVYKMAARIHSPAFGILSAFLLAFFPASIFASKIILEEHLFIPLFLSALSLLISDSENPQWKKIILAGLLLGIGAHLRTYAFAAGLLVFFIWAVVLKDWKSAVGRFLVIQGLILLVAFPWALRNFIRMGTPVLYSTAVGTALYMGNNSWSYQINPPLGQGGDPDFLNAPNEISQYRAGKKAAFTWIQKNPKTFFQYCLAKPIYLLGIDPEGWVVNDNFTTIEKKRKRPSPQTLLIFEKIDHSYYGLIFLFACLGTVFFFFFKPVRAAAPLLWWVLGTLAYYLSIVAVTLAHRKYRFAIDPLFCILAAYGILTLWFGKILYDKD